MMPTVRPAHFAAPLALVLLLLLGGCASAKPTAAATSPQPTGPTAAAPQNLHFLDMADTLEADPGDPGKKLLSVTIHVHADSATQGVVALEMIVDPSSAVPWPHPAYAGGSPTSSVQHLKLAAGDGQINGKFPLRLRQNGKVEPSGYNIQSGGFYDVLIYGGGLPASATAPTMAGFQTSRLYSLPDFGGPPATPTPVPTPTPAGAAVAAATAYPTATTAPTSTPVPTATPLPPPFAVGLLDVKTATQLEGTVGALPGAGGATASAPAGQTFVVGVFVVRRDLPTSSVNPLPTKLSTGSAGPWQPDNQQINSQTGSLQVTVPPYGPLTIVYDPRNQPDHERQVAAEVWLIPTADAANPGAFRFDGQAAGAYPMSAVSWVNPGFPYKLKDSIPLNSVSNVQVMQVKTVQQSAAPAGGATSTQPALQASIAITGSTTTPLALHLQLVLEDPHGLRASADCPVQNYAKLALGSPQQFTCTVPFPAGGSQGGDHLGVTGSVNGDAIPAQWVTLP